MDIKDFLNSVLCQFGWRSAMNQKKVFATAWHPGGANAIAPVIKRLISEKKVNIVVIGHEYSEPIFEKSGIAFQRPPKGDISVKAMKELLQKEKPNLVLLGTGSQEGKHNDIIEQTTTAAANELGVKSIAVLDYWANYAQRFTDERTGVSLDRLPSRVAVMDEFAKRDMLALGFPVEKLAITGNPYFDNLAKKAESFTEEQRQKIRAEAGCFSNDVLFFLACNVFSQWKTANGYWDLDTVMLVSRVISIFQSIKVIVRLHPRMPKEEKKQISDFIANQPARMEIDQDENPEKSQLLSLSADLTIVEDSTMGIVAVLMKRPCISLQPGLLIEDSLIVSKNRIIPVGYDINDCIALLKNSASVDFRKKIIQQYGGFSTDGKATERVANLVYSLLE